MVFGYDQNKKLGFDIRLLRFPRWHLMNSEAKVSINARTVIGDAAPNITIQVNMESNLGVAI